MANFHDLDKLVAAMKDLELRLAHVRSLLFRSEEELNTLLLLRETLEENIVELKRPGQIVMATEFRKAIEDLKKTYTRLAFLRMDRLTLETAYAGQTGMLNHLLKLHAEEIERLKHNVIQFPMIRRVK